MSCDGIRWPLTAHADWMALSRARQLRHTCLLSGRSFEKDPQNIAYFHTDSHFKCASITEEEEKYLQFVFGNKQNLNPAERWHIQRREWDGSAWPMSSTFSQESGSKYPDNYCVYKYLAIIPARIQCGPFVDGTTKIGKPFRVDPTRI